jgi:hypothetical protein
LLLIYSCAEDINLSDNNSYKKECVINGIFYADSIPKVNLTWSMPPYKAANEISFIDSCIILLYSNNLLKDTFVYQSKGNYSALHTIIKENFNYKIEVYKNNILLASASTLIPSKTIINSLDTLNSHNIRLNYNDKKNEPNYYLIKIFSYDSNIYSLKLIDFHSDFQFIEGYIENNYIYLLDKYSFKIDEQIVSFRDSYKNTNVKSIFFSDMFFDGNNVNIDISYSLDGIYKEHELYLLLISINYDYYKFLNSLGMYSDIEGDYFSEQINVHSNTINSLGILCGASADSAKFIYKNPY